jgi:hypothetical protein
MKEADDAHAIQGFLYRSGGLARAGHDAAGGSGFGSTAASHGVAVSGSGDQIMASPERSRDDLASKLARRER